MAGRFPVAEGGFIRIAAAGAVMAGACSAIKCSTNMPDDSQYRRYERLGSIAVVAGDIADDNWLSGPRLGIRRRVDRARFESTTLQLRLDRPHGVVPGCSLTFRLG